MSLKGFKILLTGGAGFIGSHLANFFLENEVSELRILDNLSTGSKENLKGLEKYPNYQFVWGDITDLETCRKMCNGVNIVCHQAALGSVPRSVDDPYTVHRVNVDGFLNMLVAARETGVEKFIYASSSAVYGDHEDPIRIEDRIGKPLSPYAVTKLANDLYASTFARLYSMTTIGFRYFNVFGPRQNPSGIYAAVIPQFIQKIMAGESPVIYGDGNQSRDFTYIDNVVQANYLAIISKDPQIAGSVFNVGTGQVTTVNQLFEIIKDSISKIVKRDYVERKYRYPRPGDVKHSYADISKISQILGYHPKVDLIEGIRRTVQFYSDKI